MGSSIHYLLKKSFDIREGERLRAVFMFVYIFLIISSLMIIKPVCNALFLKRFGVVMLPYLFVLLAVSALFLSRFYVSVLKKYDLYGTIVRTLYLSIILSIIFWGLLQTNFFKGWSLFVFYIWIAVLALVTSSQFWILANSVFNPREAKRLFSFIGTGAIAGGIFGGYLTSVLAPVIGSINLLWICVAFYAAGVPIITALERTTMPMENLQKYRRETEITEMADSSSPLRIILNSRHLKLIACIISISIITGKLVEYQFSAVATGYFSERDQLTAFFGFWLSNLNIASLAIQVFLTRRVVGVFGIGVSLLILPAALFIGSMLILIAPGLGAAIVLKLCDGSFKNSVNKAGIELLVLPVPSGDKKQAKTFIDVVVDTLSTGISGLLLILVTEVMEISVPHISYLSFVLIVIWIKLVFNARREYLCSLRTRLEFDDVPDEKSVDLQNESILDGISAILQTGNTERVLKTLRMVRDVNHRKLMPVYKNLLLNASGEIRLQVLKNIYFLKESISVEFLEDIHNLVHDADQEIRTEAMHYLFRYSNHPGCRSFEDYLESSDYAVRGAALLALAREGRRNHRLKEKYSISELVRHDLKRIPDIEDENMKLFFKINSARIIGSSTISGLYPYLYILLNDSSPKVVQAAVSAIGETRDREFLPLLMQFLGMEVFRENAVEALKGFGPDIAKILGEYLNSPLVDRKIRMLIPSILSMIGTQNAADVLLKNLDQEDPILRYQVIRAMNHLRNSASHLKFDDQMIVRIILDEAKEHLNMVTILYKQLQPESKNKIIKKEPVDNARIELIRLLEKRLDYNLERIFRLMGLKYPPGDIYNAYRNIKSNNYDLRVDAVEFLDNLLDLSLKRIVIPLVETMITAPVIDPAIEKLGMKIPTEYESMEMLLNSGDSHLHLHVLNLIACMDFAVYIPLIGKMLNSPDQRVQEMSRKLLDDAGYL